MPSTAKSDELSTTDRKVIGADQTVVCLSASTSARVARLLRRVHGGFPTPLVPIQRVDVDLPGQVSVALTAHPPGCTFGPWPMRPSWSLAHSPNQQYL